MLKLQKVMWIFIGVIYVLMSLLITPIDSFYFGRNPKQSASNQRQSRSRTYDEIAKVINPNPYNNIGGVPYPAQPFWTYAGR